MVICRQNLLKIYRPIIRPICCEFTPKQSIVKYLPVLFSTVLSDYTNNNSKLATSVAATAKSAA